MGPEMPDGNSEDVMDINPNARTLEETAEDLGYGPNPIVNSSGIFPRFENTEPTVESSIEIDRKTTEKQPKPIDSKDFLSAESVLDNPQHYHDRYLELITEIQKIYDDVKRQNLTMAQIKEYGPLKEAGREAFNIRAAFRGASVKLNENEETKELLDDVLVAKIPELF